MLEVFQLLDNHPRLGHYRVKMALDALGYRYGHTTVWPLVARDTQAQPRVKRATRLPTPDEQPRQATAPPQVWFADLRSLVKIDGPWLYSLLLFAGYSRALVGAGGCERQNRSRLSQVFRQAIAPWGAPDEVVSDHAQVFLALHPCLTPLGIRWAPITQGHPWQTLAEGGFGVPRRMLEAYVIGSPERETVYRQPTPFVQAYQCWGHWAHKRTDAQGRIVDLSPEVVLGRAQGRAIEPGRLHRTFRLRHRTRSVRAYGHLRLHNCGLSGDQSLWGHPVDVRI
jgi:hypothetical protein